MKILKSMYVFLVFVCLVSCATAEKYNRQLSKSVGLSEEELVLMQGIPTRTYQTENYKVFEYVENFQTYVSNPKYQVTHIQNEYGIDVGTARQRVDNGYYSTSSCRTTFFLRDGKVESYKFSGSACVAY